MVFGFRSAAWCVACVLLVENAVAAPLRTWGADPDTAASEEESAPEESPPKEEEPPKEAPPQEDSNVVRASGRVGLRYTLEGIEIRGNTTTLARVVLRYIPFHAGDTLDVTDKELELTRFRLLGTGFFRDVQLSLRKGTKRGRVVLVVTVAERNTLIVNDVWLGLSTDAEPNGRVRPLTAYGGIDVSETNLAGTGITLGGALAVAERQLALRTRFVDPQFLKSQWTTEAQLLYSNAKDVFGSRDVRVYDGSNSTTDYAVLPYQRFGGLLGVGHDVGSASTRAFANYRLEKIDAEVPIAASQRRGSDVEPIQFFIRDGSSVLSTLSLSVVHDTRDTPVLPTRGWYVVGQLDASLTPLGSDYPYTKLGVRASEWNRLPWGHVLRFEAIAGAIFGEAPVFEKFYVGDFTDLRPHRVLDLSFDRRQAPNFFNTAIAGTRYGDYAARINTEYRIPIYRGHRSIYGIDVFGSTGLYAVVEQRDIERPISGYRGLRRVPIDLTFNLGLRIDTSIGGFGFGIASLLGFIPVRSEGQ